MTSAPLSIILGSLVLVGRIFMLDAFAQSPEKNPHSVEPSSVPIQILAFKVGSDYPLSVMSLSESSQLPQVIGDGRISQLPRNPSGSSPRVEDPKARGQSNTPLPNINDATFVQADVKNTGIKPIQRIDWDFAFPRYVNGVLAMRFDVSSKVKIKPGGKKKLEQKLPAGASKCQVIHVNAEGSEKDSERFLDSVCEKGIHDSSYLNQKPITIKRIEYADGSVWVKP